MKLKFILCTHNTITVLGCNNITPSPYLLKNNNFLVVFSLSLHFFSIGSSYGSLNSCYFFHLIRLFHFQNSLFSICFLKCVSFIWVYISIFLLTLSSSLSSLQIVLSNLLRGKIIDRHA